MNNPTTDVTQYSDGEMVDGSNLKDYLESHFILRQKAISLRNTLQKGVDGEVFLGMSEQDSLAFIRSVLSINNELVYAYMSQSNFPVRLSLTRKGLGFEMHALKGEQYEAYNNYILSLFEPYGIYQGLEYLNVHTYKGRVEVFYAYSREPDNCLYIDLSGDTTSSIIYRLVQLRTDELAYGMSTTF